MFTMSSAVISDRLQALTRRLDSGGQAGRLKLYTLPRPAAGQPAGSAVLLAELPFKYPSLDVVVGKVLTLRNPDTTLAQVTGEVGWGRMESSVGEWIADGDVGITGDTDKEFLIDGGSTLIYAGGEISVSVAQLQEP